MKPDLQQQIAECTTELTDIDQRIAALPPLDSLKLYLTKYALIRSCGTLEHVYKAIIADFFDQFPSQQMYTYLEGTVRLSSDSATYEKMCKFLGKFDQTWKDTFKQNVQQNPDGQRIIQSAESLVKNRHRFAHGHNPTATFGEIQRYFNDALQLVIILDQIVI